MAADQAFQVMMLSIRPYLIAFAVSGITLMLGLWIVLWHGFRLIGIIQRGRGAQPSAELNPA